MPSIRPHLEIRADRRQAELVPMGSLIALMIVLGLIPFFFRAISNGHSPRLWQFIFTLGTGAFLLHVFARTRQVIAK